MCVNKDCEKYSLMCNEIDCQKCMEESHQHCYNVPLKSITIFLQERVLNHKNFVINLCKIENNFVEELCKNRLKMGKKYYLGDLNEEFVRITEQIYMEKNTKCLVGAKAEEFLSEVRKTHRSEESDSVALQ